MPTPPCLYIRSSGSTTTRIVELRGLTARLGRGPACEVRVDDPSLPEVVGLFRRRNADWYFQPFTPEPLVGLDGRAVTAQVRLAPGQVLSLLGFEIGYGAEPRRPREDLVAAVAPEATPRSKPESAVAGSVGSSKAAGAKPRAVPIAKPVDDGAWRDRWKTAAAYVRAREGRSRPAPTAPVSRPLPDVASPTIVRRTERAERRPVARPITARTVRHESAPIVPFRSASLSSAELPSVLPLRPDPVVASFPLGRILPEVVETVGPIARSVEAETPEAPPEKNPTLSVVVFVESPSPQAEESLVKIADTVEITESSTTATLREFEDVDAAVAELEAFEVETRAVDGTEEGDPQTTVVEPLEEIPPAALVNLDDLGLRADPPHPPETKPGRTRRARLGVAKPATPSSPLGTVWPDATTQPAENPGAFWHRPMATPALGLNDLVQLLANSPIARALPAAPVLPGAEEAPQHADSVEAAPKEASDRNERVAKEPNSAIGALASCDLVEEDLPSARVILAAAEAFPSSDGSSRRRRSEGPPRRHRQPEPSRDLAPAAWSVPWSRWVWTPLLLGWIAVLAMMGRVSIMWMEGDRWANELAGQLLSGSKLPEGPDPRRIAREDDLPTPTWWNSTPPALMLRAAATGLWGEDAQDAERAKELRDASGHAAPGSIGAMAHSARRAVDSGDPAELPHAMGLPRESRLQAMTARTLLREGRIEPARRALVKAIELAIRARESDLPLPDFRSGTNERRFEIPLEAEVAEIVGGLGGKLAELGPDWLNGLPHHAVIPLAVAREGIAGGADSSKLLELAVEWSGQPAPAGSLAAVHAAAGAEALARLGRLEEAEKAYRQAIARCDEDQFRRSWSVNLADVCKRLDATDRMNAARRGAMNADLHDPITEVATRLQMQDNPVALGFGTAGESPVDSEVVPAAGTEER